MREERQKSRRSTVKESFFKGVSVVRPNGERVPGSELIRNAAGSGMLGRLVRSEAGHDMGTYLVVVGAADDQRVLTADGKLRTMDKPKLKKLRHLTVTDRSFGELSEKLIAGCQIQDAELRKFIASETAGETRPGGSGSK